MTVPDPSATPPAKATSPLMRVARILWIFVAIIVVMGVLGSVLGTKKKDEQSTNADDTSGSSTPAVSAATEPAAAKKNSAATPLATSIDGFEAAIPILKQRGRKTQQSDGAATHSWKNLSVSGGKNFLTLMDSDNNDVAENGVAGIMMLKDNQTSQLEGLVFAMKLVETASGEPLKADQFTSWFIGAMGGKETTRTFGTVVVKVSRVDANDGSLFMVALNP